MEVRRRGKCSISGKTNQEYSRFTHPQFDPIAFFLHELGVVVLDKPVFKDEYGVLTELDQLDVLKTRRGLFLVMKCFLN